MRRKKNLAYKKIRTYMLDGNYFYTPNFRKKSRLLSDLTIKALWKPFDISKQKKSSLEVYLSKWAK